MERPMPQYGSAHSCLEGFEPQPSDSKFFYCNVLNFLLVFRIVPL